MLLTWNIVNSNYAWNVYKIVSACYVYLTLIPIIPLAQHQSDYYYLLRFASLSELLLLDGLVSSHNEEH